MNAIEDSAFRRAWAELGRALPKPEAILCVSPTGRRKACA
jgi:4,5-DOPA dioxygenase extradiol